MTSALAALLVIVLWWFATGAIYYLDHRPPRSFAASFAVASGLAAAAWGGVVACASSATVAYVLCAFLCVLVLWAWIEMSFLFGYVTGPRRRACPKSCSGGAHFRHAVGAILYHELAIAATGVILIALVWNAPNPVAAQTFVILWVMRTSAKLNLFLGVRNTGARFLPAHLAYLAGYFRERPLNALMPLSIGATATLAVMIGAQWAASDGESAQSVSAAMLTVLLALGILEHLLMVLPWGGEALWAWADRQRGSTGLLRARRGGIS